MPQEIIGRRFGQLTVVAKRTDRNASGNYVAYVTVRCDCGNEYETHRGNVTRGASTSCKNCRRAAQRAQRRKGVSHPLYATWVGMIKRCHDPKAPQYVYYGERGVAVCARWRGQRRNGEQFGSVDGFHKFVADMGPKPSRAHSIDRINPFGGYDPENCRWATPAEQYQNMRTPINVYPVEYRGETRMLAEWERTLGLCKGRLRRALQAGIPPAAALRAEVAIKDADIPRHGRRAFYKDVYTEFAWLYPDH